MYSNVVVVKASLGLRKFPDSLLKSLAQGKLFCSCQPTQLHESSKLVICMKFAPNEIDSRYYLL